VTDSPLLGGRLRIRQPRDGYRYAVDSLLLAWFVLSRVRPGGATRGLELGGGCGVVTALVLAGRGASRADVVELQPLYHEAAQATAELCGLGERMACHLADLRRLPSGFPGPRPALVWSNPPYHPLGRGRVPPLTPAAVARHEVEATLGDVLDAASRLLPSRGRLFLTYPAARLGEVLAGLPAHHLVPTRLVLAWSDEARDASRLLLEARKAVRSPLSVGPPLRIHDGEGGYGAWYRELCQRIGE